LIATKCRWAARPWPKNENLPLLLNAFIPSEATSAVRRPLLWITSELPTIRPEPRGGTSAGLGFSRPCGLFSSGLRRLSCRLSKANEASPGRSPAAQGPPWSLSPRGATYPIPQTIVHHGATEAPRKAGGFFPQQAAGADGLHS
jgi:hypothetical protein